jgi:signal transduction histidine kinase
VTFVADQLVRLEESPFFQPDRLEEQMPGSVLFGPSRTRLARELHRNIVHHLFELALKISIVEKFQDNSA